MRLLTHRLLVRPWSGAILAFLTIVIFGDIEARAGCTNHSVTSQTQPMGLSAYLERLLTSGAIPAPGSQSPQNPPAPCSGALCSGLPAAPDSSLPLLAPVGGDTWAMATVPFTQPSPGSFDGLSVDSSPRPADHSSEILHPPRHLTPPVTL